MSSSAERSWTTRLGAVARRRHCLRRSWLPDSQPSYVACWTYIFGVPVVERAAVLIASGVILALKGPTWWHVSSVGHFFNSIHLWSVELFFLFMVVHLWGKYWMAAWRGGRTRVWITGAVTFLVAVPCALTGYVSQQNFDAQWISTQAKDAMNSIGVGSFFNLMNFGQMYSWHILLLPVAVVALVVAHVLLVRKHGVVPPPGWSGQPRGRRPRRPDPVRDARRPAAKPHRGGIHLLRPDPRDDGRQDPALGAARRDPRRDRRVRHRRPCDRQGDQPVGGGRRPAVERLDLEPRPQLGRRAVEPDARRQHRLRPIAGPRDRAGAGQGAVARRPDGADAVSRRLRMGGRARRPAARSPARSCSV